MAAEEKDAVAAGEIARADLDGGADGGLPERSIPDGPEPVMVQSP